MNIQNKNGGRLHLDGEDTISEEIRLLRLLHRTELNKLNVAIDEVKVRLSRLETFMSLINERFVIKEQHNNGITTIYNF